jgi:uncharacterized phage infection (PIP) family protein YhgE
MPVKESKEFSVLSQQLEAVADGIKLHSKEQNFPDVLKEQEIRDLKKKLEDSREAYEKTQAEADQKHNTYEGILKQAQNKVSGAQRILQGFHGLRSELLKDYGFTPPKPGGKKGKRTKP